MARGLCNLISFILVSFALLGTIHAAELDGATCKKYLYDALKGNYPSKNAFKGSWLHGSDCTATATSAGSNTLKFQGDYTIECIPSKLSPEEYLCVNDRNKHVGDVTLRAKFTATCKNLNNTGKTECTVVNVTKIIDVTKKPSPLVPPPQGVWTKVPVFFLPKKVEDVIDETVASVATMKEAAPISSNYVLSYNSPSFGTGYYERKVDAKGTTWKLRSVVTTESLAGSACLYPKLQQEIQTMPFESKTGSITVSGKGISIGKAKIIDGKDEEEPPNCVGGAAWKKRDGQGE